MTPIHLRNLPPPEETFDHTNFIKEIVRYLKPENYLELGVRCGRTFLEISKLSKRATAVDICNPQFPIPENATYHKMTTDYFFDNNADKLYDLIFIDADHSFEQSYKDFINASTRIMDDGFIILHDTYPYDPVLHQPRYCNDCYRTAHAIKQSHSDFFEIITLPFNPGLTLVKRMDKNKQLIYEK